MEILLKLQQWYQHHCDGDWEHGNGIKIDTLDNPGWEISISLEGTELEDMAFQSISIERSDNDWIICRINEKAKIFEGFGGPFNLIELLSIFLNWADLKSVAE